MGRFSDDELVQYDKNVFNNPVVPAIASCGDCHVKSPKVGGFCLGPHQGTPVCTERCGENMCCLPWRKSVSGIHRSIRRCKGCPLREKMMCLDCHSKEEMHGDGNVYTSRKQVKQRPSCLSCHPYGMKKAKKGKKPTKCIKTMSVARPVMPCPRTRIAMAAIWEKGAKSKTGFYLGLNPRDKKTITTLRAVPYC